MKTKKSRWLSSCLATLALGIGGLAVTKARAEYIFVVIDLNRPYYAFSGGGQMAGAGGAGGLGGEGADGIGSGMAGMAGMGGPGMGRGGGMGMGGPGMGRGGGMGPGGMGMGGPGMGGPGMGRGGGMGPGGMGMGGPGMGGPGMGRGGGMGPGGMGMGGPGMGPGGMGMGGPAMGEGGASMGFEAMPVPDLLFAVVEINDPKKDNKLLNIPLQGVNVRRLTTNRGEALVIQHDGSPMAFERLVDDSRQSMPPVSQRLINFKSALANRPRTEQVLEGGRWAVEHGLYEEFLTLINDSDPKVVALPQAQAWKKAEAALKGSLPSSPQVESIKAKYPNARQRVDGDFCTILAEVDPQSLAPVKEAANLVDRQVRLLYAWFALQGQALPALPNKLVLVVLDKTDLPPMENRFEDIHGFTSPQLGGYSVMSLKNVDPKLRQLSSRLDQYARSGWDLNGLKKLQDKSYPTFLESGGLKIEKLSDVAYVSSMNLLKEALQLEERRAAIGFVS